MNPSDNNSFGMPNDSGDIILGGGEKKGGKKWIFGVIGIVVVAALVALGAWMMGRDGGGMSSGDAVMQDAFNTYANYLLHKKDSTEDIGEYDSAVIYAPEAYLEETAEDFDDYENTLSSLRGELLNSINNSQMNNKTYFDDALKAQAEGIQFIGLYLDTTEPSNENIMNYFREKGADATEKYINGFYSKMSGAESNIAQNYVETRKLQHGAFLEYLKILPEPCVGMSNYEQCNSEMAAVRDQAAGYIESMNKNREQADAILAGAGKSVANSCFVMKKRMSLDENEE